MLEENEDWPAPSDRAGRVYQRFGAARSAVERVDPRDRAETAFAREIARELGRRGWAASGRRLMVAAPPRMLGKLRKAVPALLRGGPVVEIPSDYADRPASEIHNMLFRGTGRASA